VGWISLSSSNRPRIARLSSRSTTDAGRRSRRWTTFSYVSRENDTGGGVRAYMLTVAETTVASVFSSVQIWRVSCSKEFHAQGPSVLVSLGWVVIQVDPFTTSSLSITSIIFIHPLHCIIGIIGIKYRHCSPLLLSRYHCLKLYPLFLSTRHHLSDILLVIYAYNMTSGFGTFSFLFVIKICNFMMYDMVFCSSPIRIFFLSCLGYFLGALFLQ